jgi:light-regulated signal transduction histidine kinase (bacteriophytochrome)
LPVPAGDILHDALGNLHSAIQESGATIVFGTLPVIRCNRSQIMHLFQNLVANAIKYRSSDSPRIHISAAEQASAWVFSVADNGMGMKPEYQEVIFEPFKRLHGRADYPGTGIGLAICKRVVERQGGRIWVESEPGAGSTFFFTIARSGPGSEPGS